LECGRAIVGRDKEKLEALFGELGPVKEQARTT
jgi:hypothetical protein